MKIRAKTRKHVSFFMMVTGVLALMPALAASGVDTGSVYQYQINWAVQTSPTEITVEVQAEFCGACNPNPSGNPGCTAFGSCFTGYGHQGCSAGYPDGTYIAVRVKDAGGTELGMEKRVLQYGVNGFDVGKLSVWHFVFGGLNVNCGGTVTVEADTYCSWCGHWYPTPVCTSLACPNAEVTYTGDTGACPGTNAQVCATLVDVDTGDPIVGRTVTFTLDPSSPIATASAITDASGVACTTMLIPAGTPLGTYVMDTRFGGDASYFPCSDQDDFLVGAHCQVTYTGDTSVVAGGNANVSAILLDALTGAPLAGRTITFTLDPGSPIATVSAVTNALGIASTTMLIPPNTPMGVYTMDTRFAGDACYFGCCDQDDINVRSCRAPTAEVGGPYSGVVGQPITFNGGRSYDPDGPIPWYQWQWYIDPHPKPSDIPTQMCGPCPFPDISFVTPEIFYEWTTKPTCQHTWHSAFSGKIRMSVMDEQGLNDWDDAYVVVTGPQTALQLVLKSHADLHVYDPQNRHVGVDYETGTMEKQIPDCSCMILDELGYEVPCTASTPGEGLRQVVAFPVYMGGVYCLKLVGTSDGPFELEITGTQDEQVVAQKVYSADILKGEVIMLCLTAQFVTDTLRVDFPALVYPPAMQVDPVEKTLSVVPANFYSCQLTIKELRGKTPLQGVNLACTGLTGPGTGMNSSKITFDLNNFDVAPGDTQMVRVNIAVPQAFVGKTTAVIVVKSANAPSQTVNLTLKTPGKHWPVPDAGGPYRGLVGQPITLDAGKSYDVDGPIDFYGWDWNHDGKMDEYAFQPTCVHVWTTPGTRKVRVFIYDEDGMIDWDDATVVVE